VVNVSNNTKIANAICGNVSHIPSLPSSKPKVKPIYLMYFNAFWGNKAKTGRRHKTKVFSVAWVRKVEERSV